jgi:4-amino-4-deoxy-L-arabinose transferase-like glycosyltransferase
LTSGRLPALLAIFILAATIRVAVSARFQGLSTPPNVSANPDSREYELIAYNLSFGHGYAFHSGVPTAARPPGTSLTFVLPYLVFGRSFFAERCWIIFLSALTCVITAWLATQLATPMVGNLAGVWLAVYPGHFYYAMHFLSEPVYRFWLSLSVAFTVYAFRRKAIWWDICAGLSWSIAVLTRVELLVAVPIVWLGFVATERATKSRALEHITVQSLVVCALVSVWVLRNLFVIGVPSLSTQRGVAFWGAHNAIAFTDPQYGGSWLEYFSIPSVKAVEPLRGSEADRDRQAWNYGLAAVTKNIRQVPRLEVLKLRRLLSPSFETSNRAAFWALAVGWLVTAPFVLWGICRIVAQPRTQWSMWAPVLLPILSTVVMCEIFYGAPRFRDAVSPLFVIIAAYGIMGRTELSSFSFGMRTKTAQCQPIGVRATKS